MCVCVCVFCIRFSYDLYDFVIQQLLHSIFFNNKRCKLKKEYFHLDILYIYITISNFRF